MERAILLLPLLTISSNFAHIPWDNDRLHIKSTTIGSSLHKEEEKAWYWEKIAKKTLLKHRQRSYIRDVAKNAIMFLGDGMSVQTVTAARIFQGQRQGSTGEETSLHMDQFPFVGLSKTYCVNVQTADSACSATAYLGGVKNNDATIGVTAAVMRGDCDASNLKENRVYSIMKWAQRAGKSTGIVTTTRITHASPAGAYAHVADRDWEADSNVVSANKDPKKCDDIAEQLVYGETGKHLNVIMGGGRKELLPATVTDPEGFPGVRLDGIDLIKEWLKQKKGFKKQYVWNKDQLLSVNSKKTDFLLGLFDPDHMEYHLLSNNSRNPTLAEMTKKAIKILRKNPKGFVLFVEGGRIDHAHHDTRSQLSLDETVEMDKAVQVAADMTKEEDTLTVVTADHSHTFTIAGYPIRGNPILVDEVLSGCKPGGFFDVSRRFGPCLQNHIQEPNHLHPEDGLPETGTETLRDAKETTRLATRENIIHNICRESTSSISFRTGGTSDVDNLKYTTISYANGPGYKHPTATGGRYDISADNTQSVDYTFMATAPLSSETHGAEDVAVYSKGPWAELFTGTFEQNFIMHGMCYALDIGPASHWSHHY